MIPECHKRFQRWAEWTQSGSGTVDLGIGRNILDRVMEGKGQILPGAPYKNSGRVYQDEVAVKVQTFTRTLRRSDLKLIQVFYLWPVDVASDKAAQLNIPVRTMYSRLHNVHRLLKEWWE